MILIIIINMLVHHNSSAPHNTDSHTFPNGSDPTTQQYQLNIIMLSHTIGLSPFVCAQVYDDGNNNNNNNSI